MVTILDVLNNRVVREKLPIPQKAITDELEKLSDIIEDYEIAQNRVKGTLDLVVDYMRGLDKDFKRKGKLLATDCLSEGRKTYKRTNEYMKSPLKIVSAGNEGFYSDLKKYVGDLIAELELCQEAIKNPYDFLMKKIKGTKREYRDVPEALETLCKHHKGVVERIINNDISNREISELKKRKDLNSDEKAFLGLYYLFEGDTSKAFTYFTKSGKGLQSHWKYLSDAYREIGIYAIIANKIVEPANSIIQLARGLEPGK